MSWAAAIPIAVEIGNVLGAGSSKAATEDQRARDAAALRLDIHGLAAAFNQPMYLGRSISSWMGAKRGSQDARQFLRVTAVAVGAVDAGYRQRGDAGSAQALSSLGSWAQAVDRQHGTGLAGFVSSQDPAGFIRAVQAVGGVSSPIGGGAPSSSVTGGLSVQVGKPGQPGPGGLSLWWWALLPLSIWALSRMGVQK